MWIAWMLLACSEEVVDPDVTTDRPRALVVGWDGVRGDAVSGGATPGLDRLAGWGALTTQASTQLTGPCKSAPGWMSILTGVEPDKHGVVANGDYSTRDAQFTTLVQRSADQGLSVGLAVHWPEIALSISEEGAAAEATLGLDPDVNQLAVDWIAEGTHDVLFIHLDDPDHEGHALGWGSPEYQAAVERSDGLLIHLLDAIELREQESWLVMVTTDHGGSGTDHGDQDADNQTIFLGMGRTDGGSVDLAGANHMDVTPTVLDHFGLAYENLDGTSRW